MKKKIELSPSISERKVWNIEEVDNLTLPNSKDQMPLVDTPGILILFVDVKDKNTAEAVSYSLSTINKLNVQHLYMENGVWTVEANKMIFSEKLKEELKKIRAVVKLHSCKISEWYVNYD